jgi:DNA repair photolyase
MFKTQRNGSFIKQFVGPGNNKIVCFKFWQAVIASGCPGECSYCFLQNQYPYRSKLYDIKGTLFENLSDIVPEVKKWLKRPGKQGLILGENQDGLAFESPYKKLLGFTPLELLIPLFENENPVGHTLIVLSKFTSTQYAESLGGIKNVVFSWSLSLPSISKKYEKKVASLDARLRKAAELKEKGFRIRFRLDALAPIPNWEEELTEVIERINDIEPEMLTIGALRSSHKSNLRRTAEKNQRDGSIFDYISTIDPSGFKYRTETSFHLQSFRKIKNLLKANIRLGLCKEDISIWQGANVEWQGCHCLSGVEDSVTKPQNHLLEQTKNTYPVGRSLPIVLAAPKICSH